MIDINISDKYLKDFFDSVGDDIWCGNVSETIDEHYLAIHKKEWLWVQKYANNAWIITNNFWVIDARTKVCDLK